MEPMYEAFYTHSMLRNAEAAIRCYFRVEKMLAPLASGMTTDAFQALPTRQILDELQSLVTYAGALARYFWPSYQKYQARGEYLRIQYGLDSSSPLANKDLRNALEHFDERLDNYLAGGGVVGIILPDYVGPAVDTNGIERHLFRAFFIDSGCFVLFNEKFYLQPLLEEVIRVAKRLKDKDLDGVVFYPRAEGSAV